MSAEGKPFTIITIGELDIKLRLSMNELALLDELFDLAISDLGDRRILSGARAIRQILYVCANRDELLKSAGGDPRFSLADIGDMIEPHDLRRIAFAVAESVYATFSSPSSDDGDGEGGEKKSESPGAGEPPEDKPSDPSD